jgi:hypothetical protein
MSFATGKAAIEALLLRIMGPQNKWQRWVVWMVIILITIGNTLNCIFNFVQCRPVQANWNPDLPHDCWDVTTQLNFVYFMSGSYDPRTFFLRKQYPAL